MTNPKTVIEMIIINIILYMLNTSCCKTF